MADKKRAKSKQRYIVEICADGGTMEKVINVLQVLVELAQGEVSYTVLDEEGEQPEAAQTTQTEAVRPIPQELDTPKAHSVLDGLVGIHVLDDHYQPLGLSWTLRSYLAYQISVKLGFTNVWKVFAEFWGMNARTLKARYNDALKMDSIADFYDKIKGIVG